MKKQGHYTDQHDFASAMERNRRITADAVARQDKRHAEAFAAMAAKARPITLDEAIAHIQAGGRPEDFPCHPAFEALRSVDLRPALAPQERGAKGGAQGCPPSNNTEGAAPIQPQSKVGQVVLMLSDGVLKEVPVRMPGVGQSAIIDWINFTVKIDQNLLAGGISDHYAHVIGEFSSKLQKIFGYPVTRQLHGGSNFYEHSFELGQKYGFVLIGGERQKNTICVMINGTGLTAASEGWERRLYDYLKYQASSPRLSRIDLAYDDFTGQSYTVDQADTDYDADLFTCHNIQPDYERRGSWRRITGKGRSFYVGHRTSGKYLRVYEKGKQLGCKESPWVRVELEFKNSDRVLLLEMLLNPGEYLAGAYPALHWISDKKTRLETYEAEVEHSYDQMVTWLKRQAGPSIDFMIRTEQAINPEGALERVIEAIRRDALPGKLKKYVMDAQINAYCAPASSAPDFHADKPNPEFRCK